ncbi:type II secretion system protein [Haloferula rosea]|uniref:Type II secretion system protein n=1 Tax=Haloferula rosea TaxID=490093 RepID=A0A934VEJ6_9BACT|nr:prepilin-type N-terminal cleavage/methylation domain-containing protein [Haloferula rosea]MBK1827389.1 type II secretion system protein [Haloferula rosea]
MKSAAFHRAGNRGFTLLELVLAIGLLALLVGMIFSVATQNIALGNAVVARQNEESLEAAFIDLLGDQFSAMPGNARMELTSEDTGAQYLSDLTIQNVPLSFTWGGAERIAKAVQISTVRRRDGLLDIVMRYYENEVLEETQEVGDSPSVLDDEPFAEVILLEDVQAFEWQVLDGRTMEWQYDWDLVGRLPLQMELVYAMAPEDIETPVRQIFWITPKQNPEVMMRQLQQQGQQDQQGGGDGGSANPGDGETPSVSIPNPPTDGGGGGRGDGGGGGRGGSSGQRGGGR